MRNYNEIMSDVHYSDKPYLYALSMICVKKQCSIDNILNNIPEHFHKQIDNHRIEKYRSIIVELIENYQATDEDVFATFSRENGDKQHAFFETPNDLRDLIFRLADNSCETIYDFSCGTGSLLRGADDDVKVFGQELSYTRAFYAYANLCERDCEIRAGNTLTNDKFDQKFDLIVGNPPFGTSCKDIIDELKDDDRFPVLPTSFRDSQMLFILHALAHLKPGGRAFLVVGQSVLSSNTDKNIRMWLLKNGYIDTVISLPEGLFENTTIGTSIIVLRNKQRTNGGVKMINATQLCKPIRKRNSKKKVEITPENIDTINMAYVVTFLTKEQLHQVLDNSYG